MKLNKWFLSLSLPLLLFHMTSTCSAWPLFQHLEQLFFLSSTPRKPFPFFSSTHWKAFHFFSSTPRKAFHFFSPTPRKAFHFFSPTHRKAFLQHLEKLFTSFLQHLEKLFFNTFFNTFLYLNTSKSFPLIRISCSSFRAIKCVRYRTGNRQTLSFYCCINSPVETIQLSLSIIF